MNYKNVYVLWGVFGLACVLLMGCGNSDVLDTELDDECAPMEQFSVEHSILQEYALVLCEGEGVETFSLVSGDRLPLIPAGGTHTLHLYFHNDWELPDQEEFLPNSLNAFAGFCSVEDFCTVEYTDAGQPDEENRLAVTLLKHTAQHISLSYTLPTDMPRQVAITMDFCNLFDMWDNETYCVVDGDLRSSLGYTFRYESIEHIPPKSE